MPQAGYWAIFFFNRPTNGSLIVQDWHDVDVPVQLGLYKALLCIPWRARTSKKFGARILLKKIGPP